MAVLCETYWSIWLVRLDFWPVIVWSSCSQVNSQATLLFFGLVNEEVHENIFWPDLPYLTDEHGSELELMLRHSVLAIQGFISSALFASRCCVSGLLSDIYFQVNNDEDIMRTLTSDDNYVVRNLTQITC